MMLYLTLFYIYSRHFDDKIFSKKFNLSIYYDLNNSCYSLTIETICYLLLPSIFPFSQVYKLNKTIYISRI